MTKLPSDERPEEGLNARLERQPVRVECPICRHRQWMRSPTGRCDQCGSEITLYESRPAAQEALDALTRVGRIAYIVEPAEGLWAVIANRLFRNREP